MAEKTLTKRDVFPGCGQMEEQPALDLVARLCETLATKGIGYCHWKSNATLSRSANGQNDLDLLIEKSDAKQFDEIIHRLGFKEAVALQNEQFPEITHHYALDSSSGQLVHLHKHYQLIVGHDLTKNYHLPLETPYIESAIHEGLFKVPTPEWELIVFVIRMILKRPLLDRHRHTMLSPYASTELKYLVARASMEKLRLIRRAHLHQVSDELWQESLHSLQSMSPWWARTKVGWKLRQALRDYRRRPCFVAATLKIWRRYRTAVRARLVGHPSRKTMRPVGSITAIVGGDGAGKSTAVHGVAEWLAKDFEVLQTHMGKPPKHLITSGLEWIIRVFSWVRMLRRYAVHEPLGKSWDVSSFKYLLMLRSVCLARDRFLLSKKMRCFALRGGLVICDRYYLPLIKLMDAPQLGVFLEEGNTQDPSMRIARHLARIEQRYYQGISGPDTLIVLQITPEIAIRRKPEENAELVKKRSQEVWDVDWAQTLAHVIDAKQSPIVILSMIKSIIWRSL